MLHGESVDNLLHGVDRLETSLKQVLKGWFGYGMGRLKFLEGSDLVFKTADQLTCVVDDSVGTALAKGKATIDDVPERLYGGYRDSVGYFKANEVQKTRSNNDVI